MARRDTRQLSQRKVQSLNKSKRCIDHCRPGEAGAVQGTVRYRTLLASSDARNLNSTELVAFFTCMYSLSASAS